MSVDARSATKKPEGASMTQPDPASVAPAEDQIPAPQQPAVPDPGAPADPAPFDPKTLSPEAQAWLKGQVDAADKKARTTSKENAAQAARAEVLAEFAQKLGLVGDDTPPTADELTGHLERAQDLAWNRGTRLAIYRAAGKLGADPDALLDSMSFLDTLDDLTESDPDSDDFSTTLAEKIQAAMERDARFRVAQQPTTPRPDPSQGSRGGAGLGIDARIAEAQGKGDWRTVISLQNEKLANLKP